MPTVRTVLGDLDAAELGRTYCHEHLLTRPGPRIRADDDDLVLDDPARSIAELQSFKSVGGGAVVEVTTPEFGRDAFGLARLSEQSGVHIVACAGHVSEEYWRGVLPIDRRDESDLVREFVRDLTQSIEGGPVRAGVIKVGTSRDEATAVERLVMRAAAQAQIETGAPITTHTTAGTAALQQVRVLEDAGADLTHVCIGHLDRRLVWEDHLALARSGVFLGYDCISKEQYESDERRAEFIVRLVDAGFGNRILLSGDLARRSYLEAWGGWPGYRHIIGAFLPRLQLAGLRSEHLDDLLVANPARFLAWAT
ncbi:MAG: phosphotriesterase family protein [Actinomycetota bacterium]